MVAQAPIGVLHYVEEQVYKAQKALVAAKFNGIALTAQKFDYAKESKKPAFLAMNPVGKVPFLETDMGCIASSNAIARYVARCRADKSLYGNCFDDEGQIDTWIEFSTYELEIPIVVWLYPVLGVMEQPKPEATENAKSDIKKALQALEDRLKVSPFLVGDFVTLADIVLVCVLREAFCRLFDPAFRKPYPKVCAWFELCVGMPEFSSVFGATALCKQSEKPIPVKAAFVPPARGAEPKKEAKKEEPKKDAKKAEAKKEAKAEPKAKAAGKAEAAPPATEKLSPELEGKIRAVGDDIRVLKDKLKAEGKSGPEINQHEGIKELVVKLQGLKAQIGKEGPAPAAAGGDVDAQVKAVGDEIRVLKEKLKGEGLSGKKVNDHEEVKALVAKLNELKNGQGAAPAAASPKGSPKAAPAPAPSGGDLEAQIKTVGDEIRVLKEKLKAEGLSGKKVNDHAEVKELVGRLQELKKQQA